MVRLLLRFGCGWSSDLGFEGRLAREMVEGPVEGLEEEVEVAMLI